MRLLVVGHSFVTAFAQRKYAAMKALDRALEVRVLVPRRVKHTLMTYTAEVGAGLRPEDVVSLDTIFPFRSNMTYMFRPAALRRQLQEFRPDVVCVEEEPHALVTAETVMVAAGAAPEAAICVFTWDNLYRRRRFPLGVVKRRLGAFTLERCAAVVCGNREAERLLRKRRGYRGPCVVLPQIGVDPGAGGGAPSTLRRELGMEGALCVGYVGRLVPEKGVLVLLQALALLERHPWKLLLVGAGPLEEQIQAQWVPRFRDRLVRVPAVPHAEVTRYLRCLDIFVLPSRSTARWKEQFGLTAAQAMMAEVPTVGSSCGAIPEVLGPGGLIVPEGDATALAAGLEELMVSREKRKAIGSRARTYAVERYATDAVAARYLQVFEAAYARC
jgi:glycosyltransferase involved in cell wall biosynthesis